MKGLNSWRYSSLLVLCVILKSCEGSPGFREMGKILVDLAVDYNDEPVPEYLKNALAQTITDDSTMNKYDGSMGDPRARRSIAKFYSKSIGRELNWEDEVITSVGATEAMSSTVRGLSVPGDEWILIQPFFNMFKSVIELAFCVPVYADLKPRKIQENLTATDWEVDRAKIKSLINAKTKGIIFNNPNNPLGKCYTREELDFIAQLAKDHNLLVISDEVYEFTTDSMIKLASLPGMFERTLTIGSASKAFCVPGWRVGWVFGPKELISKINEIHGRTLNFDPPAQQRAVATIFEDEYMYFGSPESFLSQNLASIKRKRKFIVQAFRKAGMIPIMPYGGYCMLSIWPGWSDWIKNQHKEGPSMNYSVASSLTNVTMIKAFPADKYYGEQPVYGMSDALRFCYHKSKQTLQNAAENLLLLKETIQKYSSDCRHDPISCLKKA